MRLWAGQGISFVGDAISLVALIVLVVDLTGSAASVGGVLVARLIPTLFSPLAGVLADRLRDRRRLLVGVDIARAGIIFCVIFTESVPLLYFLVFLLGCCQTLFNPTIRSAFPGVVGDGDLTRANALISGTFSFSVAAGPAAAGLLIAFVGVDMAFFIDAMTFLVSAAFLAFVPMPSSRGEDEEDEGFMREFREGLSYLRHARLPLALVIGGFLLILAENSTVPAEIFLARETFGVGDTGYGILVACWGMGMIFGSGVMAWLGDRANLILFYFISIFLAAAAHLGTGFAPLFIFALAALTIAGVCNGVDNVATDALLQKRVPRKFLGRVYSVLFLGRSGGEVIALAIGGLIVDAIGPQDTYLLAAAALAAVGFFILFLIATAPKKERERGPESRIEAETPEKTAK
ncbi:MAG: MFS transporter [Rubrobacter sp.]|nr:MFS transporter [Rubrobacter sp.]